MTHKLNIILVTCWLLTPVWSLRGDEAASPASRPHSPSPALTPTRSWPSWLRRRSAHAPWVSGSCVSGFAGPGGRWRCAPPPPPPPPACPGSSSHQPGEKVTLKLREFRLNIKNEIGLMSAPCRMALWPRFLGSEYVF